MLSLFVLLQNLVIRLLSLFKSTPFSRVKFVTRTWCLPLKKMYFKSWPRLYNVLSYIGTDRSGLIRVIKNICVFTGVLLSLVEPPAFHSPAAESVRPATLCRIFRKFITLEYTSKPSLYLAFLTDP